MVTELDSPPNFSSPTQRQSEPSLGGAAPTTDPPGGSRAQVSGGRDEAEQARAAKVMGTATAHLVPARIMSLAYKRHITSESPWVLGALGQEKWAETKYMFLILSQP